MMAAAFPHFDVGSLPPEGPMLPLPEVIDMPTSLVQGPRRVAGGDHRADAPARPGGSRSAMAEPRVGDICEHDPTPHRKGFADLPAP